MFSSKTPQARGNGQTPKGNPNEVGELVGHVWQFNMPTPPKPPSKAFRHSSVHFRLSAISRLSRTGSLDSIEHIFLCRRADARG